MTSAHMSAMMRSPKTVADVACHTPSSVPCDTRSQGCDQVCPLNASQGVTSWFIFSLIRGRGVPGAEAAVRISGLELGGLLGSLSAGAISDRLIKSNTDPNVGNVGLRVKARVCVSPIGGDGVSDCM